MLSLYNPNDIKSINEKLKTEYTFKNAEDLKRVDLFFI